MPEIIDFPASKPPNLPPIPAALHPDFPQGGELDVLIEVRNTIADHLEARGLKVTGCGVGVGGADVSALLDGRRISVTIKVL